MIDFNQQVVTALKEVLPTYYELYTDGSISLPAITYQEYSNYDTAWSMETDFVGYSYIQFMVKVWANSKADIETYSLKADLAMRKIGFHRISAEEMSVDDQICKLMLFEALGKEVYEEPVEGD